MMTIEKFMAFFIVPVIVLTMVNAGNIQIQYNEEPQSSVRWINDNIWIDEDGAIWQEIDVESTMGQPYYQEEVDVCLENNGKFDYVNAICIQTQFQQNNSTVIHDE